MSRPRGGYIGFNRVPSDSMPGVWTLREHDEGVRSQQWTQFYDRFWVQTRVALNYEPDFTNYAPTTYAGGTSLVNDGNGADAKASFSNVGASTTTAQEYDGSRSAQFVKNSGNYVSVSNGPVLGTGSFTIESWVYPTSYSQSASSTPIYEQDMCLCASDGGGFTVFFIANENSTNAGKLAFFTAAGNVAVYSTQKVTLNQWSHLAWCRSGTTLRSFINGTQVASGTVSGNLGSVTFTGKGTGNDRYFDGYMDNTRITLAARYTSTFVPPPVLPLKPT